jgi:CHAD domain-containing protein
VSRFVLEPEFSADEVLTGLGDLFALAPAGRTRERFTYLDTFDWRLFAAALTLAASPRRKEVRLLLTGHDGQRWEARVPRTPLFAADLPPDPFRAILEEACSIRRLLPRAHAHWHDDRFALLNEDQKTVVRLRLRRGHAALPGPRGTAPVPLQLHLESLKGYEAEFNKVGSLVRKTFRLKPQEGSELALVMGALGLAPGDYSSSFRLELAPEQKAGQALRAVHQCLLDTMLANQDGMIQDLDPEFLHDFRVAVRRARSALAQVPGVFPEEAVLHFAQEFSWLGERTGPTRDMDVYLLKIPAYQRTLPEGVREELQPLVRFLSLKKRAAHRRMVRSLGTERYARFLEEWGTYLRTPVEPDSDPPHAHRPIACVARERIWKVFRKVLKRGRKTDRKTSPETLHRLRIDCKKLRYLMTFFQSLFPFGALRPLIKELKNLQDNLGDFNDLYVQRAALLGFAAEMMASGKAPPGTLMAMGQLMGQLESRQAVEAEAFHARFQKFAREKNKDRFRKLFGPEGEEAGAPRGHGPAPEDPANPSPSGKIPAPQNPLGPLHPGEGSPAQDPLGPPPARPAPTPPHPWVAPPGEEGL